MAINYLGGWRNSMTFVLTGLDIEAKAELAERTLWSLVPGGADGFESVDVHLDRTDRTDPATNEEAQARLRVTVMDGERDRVGRAFSNAAIEMVLASYPGLFTTTPPTDATSFGVYWPALVAADAVTQHVVLDGEETLVAHGRPDGDPDDEPEEPGTSDEPDGPGEQDQPEERAPGPDDPGEVTRVPLGALLGARSGDKGGNANIGVWARSDEAWEWLDTTLTVERLRQLLPRETDGLEVRRHRLANLRALNFVLVGVLGRGVAASTRSDPQAKGLGEYLRAKVVDVPTRLLRETDTDPGAPAPPAPGDSASLDHLPPPPGA